MQIKVKKLDSSAILPAYSREGDAALDIYALGDHVLAPNERKLIPTGVAYAIPAGYCALILPRSGIASKYGITLPNSPGLIDSNYRGELFVSLVNIDNNDSYEIKSGDRIAQMLIQKTENIEFIQVDELDETNRGNSGFGSSGN